LFIGLIPDAINLFFINAGLSLISTFSTFFTNSIEQFSVFTSVLKLLLMSSPCSLCVKSTSFTFLSYIAPISYAIPKMLNKSPLFAVNSKSITLSSISRYFIGSSPSTASSPSSAIPSESSGFKNLCSNPSSAIEHNIPFDS